MPRLSHPPAVPEEPPADLTLGDLIGLLERIENGEAEAAAIQAGPCADPDPDEARERAVGRIRERAKADPGRVAATPAYDRVVAWCMGEGQPVASRRRTESSTATEENPPVAMRPAVDLRAPDRREGLRRPRFGPAAPPSPTIPVGQGMETPAPPWQPRRIVR